MTMQLNEKQKMEDWRIVKFGDVAENVVERVQPSDGDEVNFIGLEHVISGNLKIGTWGSDVALMAQALKFKQGDILFPKRNTYLKRVGIAPIDGIGSGDFIIVRPKNNKYMNVELLKYYMQTEVFFKHVIANSSGSLSKRTKFKFLSDFKMLVPPPEKQSEVLEILNKGLQSFNSLNETLSSISILKRVLISKVFSYSDAEHKTLKHNVFSEVTEIVSGQVDPKSSPYKEMPHIAPDNMEKRTGRLLGYNSAEEDGITSGKYHFDKTWLLYSKIRPKLRKLCFPKFEGVCSADVYPIRGKNGLNTEYLYYLMQSEHFNQYAISVSMRSGFPKINRDDLCAYKLVIPGINYQVKACNALREVDQQYEELLKHLEQLKTTNKKLIDEVIGKGAA